MSNPTFSRLSHLNPSFFPLAIILFFILLSLPTGVNSFEFEAEAPSPSKLPQSDILGLTVILLTAAYRDQEFIKIGYYVRTEYETQELIDDPPKELDLSRVVRNILVDKPRVTRMNITW